MLNKGDISMSENIAPTNSTPETVADKLTKPANQTGQHYKFMKMVLERLISVSTKTGIVVPARFSKGVDKATVQNALYYKQFWVDGDDDIPTQPTPLAPNSDEKAQRKYKSALGKFVMYENCKKAYEGDASELSIIGSCYKVAELYREILGSEWVDAIQKEMNPPEEV